jgi:hypothetical protein
MAGSNTRDLVTGLKKPRRGKVVQTTKKPQGTIKPKAGKGEYKSAATSGGGGIASPVTETSISDRSYYGSSTVYSSDGVFSFTFLALKKMVFKDRNGARVEFLFKQDPPPES